LVKLEIIMLIKTNQTQKGKYFVFSLIWVICFEDVKV
jgi:hypothetical protein